MNAGTLLFIVADVVALLETKAILLPDGRFDAAKLDTLQEDLAFAADVEEVLKGHGVNVPARVDSIIKLLPLIASFVR